MEWIQSVVGCSKTCKQQQEMAQTQTNHQKPANVRRTHKRVTLPPAQFSPEPIQVDDAVNRGHAVALLHPAIRKNKRKKKKKVNAET
jgi:hypothetical protein